MREPRTQPLSRFPSDLLRGRGSLRPRAGRSAPHAGPGPRSLPHEGCLLRAFARRALALAMLLCVAALIAPAALAQDPDEDEIKKLPPKDPYTEQDPERMAAAGVVSYGPFPWADHHRSEDLDRVLGEGRILWLETEHFRFGCNLKSTTVPTANGPKKALLDEIEALREKLPKVPSKPRKLDPWLRLHLFAQRAEARYAEFVETLGLSPGFNGTEPPNGPYLGMSDKFLVLLFQKNSDLVRYLDRFANVKGEKSYRHYHLKTHQMLVVIAVDAFENFDESALHSHFVYCLVANFVSCYRGFYFTLPPWFNEGLAHWFSRQVETTFVNAMPKPGEAVDKAQLDQWPKKVRARAQHERATIPIAELMAQTKYDDLGYLAHIQSWSRIDYLMHLDPKKVGEMLVRLKNLPLPPKPEQVVQAQQKALIELFELEPDQFDAKWREWVLKTYPKK